ncbi:MAG: LysM peptidoglycan-binding domain-containing protein, partial [Chloroflexi bacterium]|nr:LysM peptidoglycan-binding domain-containing protein [Chloroflexota bacterium]
MVTQRKSSSIIGRPRHTVLRLLSTVALLGLLLGLAASPATAAHTPPTPSGQQVAHVPGPAQTPPPPPFAPRAALQPTVPPTLTEQETLEGLYALMEIAWNTMNWEEAIPLIEEIKLIDPNYRDIQERHYFAYVNLGFELLRNSQCTEATQAFRDALDLRPDGEQAINGLDYVARYCVPPTPTGTITATPTSGPSPTITLAPTHTLEPNITPTQIITEPTQYVVQSGDTLFSLSRRFNTTVQAIMQANGMMTTFLRAGQTIWIPVSGETPPGPIVHIVQPGETLFSIARKYNTTVWAIMATNGLSSTTISAYRALFIPSAMQPGPIIHVVMPGETLYTIAQRYNTTVPLIMLANRMTTYSLYVYQQLVIPPEGWTGWPISWPGSGPTGPAPVQYYTVQRGDTLYSIARRFG